MPQESCCPLQVFVIELFPFLRFSTNWSICTFPLSCQMILREAAMSSIPKHQSVDDRHRNYNYPVRVERFIFEVYSSRSAVFCSYLCMLTGLPLEGCGSSPRTDGRLLWRGCVFCFSYRWVHGDQSRTPEGHSERYYSSDGPY